jgi:hypothetical protein
MLPSAHVLSALACTNKVTGRAYSIVWFPILVFAGHFFPMDAVVHMEPGLFNANYLSPRSWGFWFILVDISWSTLAAWWLWQRRTSQRWLIAGGYMGALGPDLIQAVINKGILPNHPILQAFSKLHNAAHWWKEYLPPEWIIPLGTATTLFVWAASYHFVFRHPEPKPVHKPITVAS